MLLSMLDVPGEQRDTYLTDLSEEIDNTCSSSLSAASLNTLNKQRLRDLTTGWNHLVEIEAKSCELRKNYASCQCTQATDGRWIAKWSQVGKQQTKRIHHPTK